MLKIKQVRMILILTICICSIVIFNRKNFKRLHLKYKVDKYLKTCETQGSCKAKEVCSNLPFHLTRVPLADKAGIVLDVKKVSIRNVTDPYNACILKKDEGYFLFFRLDTAYRKNIAYVELDEKFEQTPKEFSIVETKNSSSEDARVLKKEDATLLVYNEFDSETRLRLMRIAGLNPTQNQLEFVTPLNLNKNRCEKNWAPFTYEQNLFFEYYLNPHSILKMSDVKDKNSLAEVHTTEIANLAWPTFWGELRGGTPPIKIGNQYIGFFHSLFKNKRRSWYAMGAYTFEAQPPFRITALSPYPILFKGIYDSPLRSRVHCIFPCGMVSEKRDGKDLIHVSCGENDTTVKIITLDQEALLKSLKKIPI